MTPGTPRLSDWAERDLALLDVTQLAVRVLDVALFGGVKMSDITDIPWGETINGVYNPLNRTATSANYSNNQIPRKIWWTCETSGLLSLQPGYNNWKRANKSDPNGAVSFFMGLASNRSRGRINV